MTNVGEVIWKDIIGFQGHYQISNDGRIKSVARLRKGIGGKLQNLPERILKPSKSGKYLKVTLCIDDKLYCYLIHRLVAIHFVNNPNNLPMVNHMDTDKFNNNDWNLEWTNHNGNMQHGVEHNLFLFGENNPNAILSDETVMEIRTDLMHVSNETLANRLGVSYACIWDIKNNRTRTKIKK